MFDPPDPRDEDRKRRPPKDDEPFEAEEVRPADQDRPRRPRGPEDAPRRRDDRDEDRPRRRRDEEDDRDRPRRRPGEPSQPRPRDYDDRDDDDDYDRPRRRRPHEPGGEQFLIPVNVSAWSMASCYMGLIGMCLPFVGLLFAIPALIFGFIALRQNRKKQADYGRVTGDIRAVLGIIFSVISIVGHLVLLIVILANAK